MAISIVIRHILGLICATLLSLACAKKDTKNQNDVFIENTTTQDPHKETIEIYNPLANSLEVWSHYEIYNYSLNSNTLDKNFALISANGQKENLEVQFLNPLYLNFDLDVKLPNKSTNKDNATIFSNGYISTYFHEDDTERVATYNYRTDQRNDYFSSYAKLNPSSVASNYYRMLNSNFKPFCLLFTAGTPNNSLFLSAKNYYHVFSHAHILKTKKDGATVAIVDLVLKKMGHSDDISDYKAKKLIQESEEVFKEHNDIHFKCVSFYKKESEFILLKNIINSVFRNSDPLVEKLDIHYYQQIWQEAGIDPNKES